MNAADDIRIGDILSGKSGSDENFPVASRLVSPKHRGIILGFYRFVRAADDIVDHADLPAEVKHALIDRLEAGLTGTGPREPEAEPLRLALAERSMAPRHALDMLVAFRRDIDKQRTADWADLIDYCRYSAMPVGRFVLDVHGESEDLWPANDALCAALQVINHLQDCAKDYRDIGRVYIPDDMIDRHGMTPADLDAARASPALRAVLDELVVRTHALLAESAVFAGSIRDLRLGLEVAVIQRVAERILTVLGRCDPLADKVHLDGMDYVTAGLQGAVAMGARRLLRFGAPLPVRRGAAEPRS